MSLHMTFSTVMADFVHKVFYQVDGSLTPFSSFVYLYLAILASSLLISLRSRRDLAHFVI